MNYKLLVSAKMNGDSQSFKDEYFIRVSILMVSAQKVSRILRNKLKSFFNKWESLLTLS